MTAGDLASLDLVILFFFLGALASWLKSDLEIPRAASKFLSIYLLLSLGLKGGHEVRATTDLSEFAVVALLGAVSCVIIPSYLFHWLRRRIGSGNAAALAASYGSVSAVTFIAALGLLENEDIPASGYMVAVMALMEIPAIVFALYYYGRAKGSERSKGTEGAERGFSVLTSKSVVLLSGGFAIGLAMNDPTWASIKPVASDAFKGVLAFFLLDLGIIAQRQLREAWRFKACAVLAGLVLPLLHGTAMLFTAAALGVGGGDRILLAVLAGSASYIAAPAAVRAAIPEANPSLYVALPLALTFPMNLLFGIPFYMELSRWLG